MTWNDINLYQYQQIIEANKIEYPIDRIDRLIAIINNWTANQVNDLSVKQYDDQVKRLSFLDLEPEGKPVKYINVNGKRYKCIYDVRQMHSSRYIESKVFQTDLIGNLHKLAASMVVPMKKTMFGWKEVPYDSIMHSVYAEDMLEAKFVDIYHSIVFFYHVYRIWIEVSKAYLKNQLEIQGVTQSEKAIADLLSIMDGTIPQHKLQNTIVSRLSKHMNYQP
jgi:hypothetical protein